MKRGYHREIGFSRYRLFNRSYQTNVKGDYHVTIEEGNIKEPEEQ